LENAKIGFIGAGNMASSLIQGLLTKGVSADAIWAADIDDDKLRELENRCSIHTGSAKLITDHVDVIVLAVKPQVMAEACQALAADLDGRTPLIVSIAAGITIEHLQKWFGENASLVRCMPNTPALVGKGASGLFANPRVTDEQKLLAKAIMQAVGLSVWVESEADIDAVTAVSGSGPAYFFLFMEAMQDVAIEMGLSKDLARDLTYQTAIGAAELAQGSKEDIAELRRRVTSPGGTTEQAIMQFETGGLRELVRVALLAARDRSVAIAEEIASK